MALNKQKISIPFSEGINTKVDPNQRPIGTLEDLQNVVFDEPGKLKKRTGYEKLNTKLLDGTNISEVQKITAFKDELAVFNKTNFFSYSESTDLWTNKGTVSNIFPTVTPIVRNSAEQSEVVAYHAVGIDAFAWEDSRGGVRISIIDSATGNELISDTEITAAGFNPKIAAIGNELYFFYGDSTDLKYRTVNPVNPNSIGSEVTLISADLNATNANFDVISIEDRIFFCFNSLAATLKLGNLQDDGTVSAIQEEAAESPSSCICADKDPSSRFLVAYSDGTDVKAIVRSFNLASNIVAPTSLETISDVVNVTISSTDSTNCTVLYEQSAANVYDHRIRKNTIDLTPTVGTPADFIRSCGLLAKQFTFESNMYVPVIHQSTLQSTAFVLNSDAEVVSKLSQGLSGNLVPTRSLQTVTAIDSERFLFSSQIKGRTVSENNTLFSLLGVSKVIIDFGNDTRFDNARLGEQLHTNGGMVQSYDGKQIVEHGFHVFPENLENGGTATIGGSISDGEYQYLAVYAWTDNRGQLHRSAPSIPLQVTLSGGTTTQTQTVTVPTLRITEKSDVVIELYRTEGGGTIFYKVTDVASPNLNDKTVDSIDITDTLSELELISRELLYTTGGVLDNIAPPAASLIETFNKRIFLGGLEEENKLQYSKIRFDGAPVEFNDTLTINVNPRGGRIVALAAMDEKLIIFKETAIFYISGDGPNNLGQQDTFIEPELISDDVGCENQNSIVLTPEGLMFKSKKGIYLLTRSLSTAYVGAPVEEFNDRQIRSANLVATRNIAIFVTDQDALVYNYFVQQWTRYTNHSGISATTLGSLYYYVRDDNEIYVESDKFTDNGSHIPLRLETSWISFAGVQAYQRVYRMLFLGDYVSSHKVKVRVAYNFLDVFTQEEVIDTSDFTLDKVYGGDPFYGDSTVYGGAGNQYQARVNMKTQKCQSIKVIIEDAQDQDYAEGLQLSNILFVVGTKRGEFKVSQARTYGTN